MKRFIIYILFVGIAHGMEAPKPPQYMSATASISAKGFISLENAANEIVTGPLKGESLTPLDSNKYHMTLASYHIKVVPSAEGNSDLSWKVYSSFRKAAGDALRKTLAEAKSKISLTFAYIGVFEKMVVAIFQGNIEVLQRRIGAYLRNNLKDIPEITAIERLEPFQPHVSLARIGTSTFFGTGFPINTDVRPFSISRPEIPVSVQWRT